MALPAPIQLALNQARTLLQQQWQSGVAAQNNHPLALQSAIKTAQLAEQNAFLDPRTCAKAKDRRRQQLEQRRDDLNQSRAKHEHKEKQLAAHIATRETELTNARDDRDAVCGTLGGFGTTVEAKRGIGSSLPSLCATSSRRVSKGSSLPFPLTASMESWTI